MFRVLALVGFLFLGYTHAASCGTRTQVITGLEDTLISTGRVHRQNGAGVDKQWTSNLASGHVFYPGMVQFQTELDRGLENDAVDGVAVLSASSDIRSNVTVEDIKEGSFAKMFQQANGAVAEVLLGKLQADVKTTPQGVSPFITIANEKLTQQREYQRANRGKFNFVFVGDNTAGDVHVGRTMLKDRKSCVKAVFIHDVMGSAARDSHRPLHNVGGKTQGLYTYQTAADAGVTAVQKNMISPAGLDRIISSIKESPQWKACKTTCECKSCGSDKLKVQLSDRPQAVTEAQNLLSEQDCWCTDCQADKTGRAPGCAALVKQVEIAESFLKQLSECSVDSDCPSSTWCQESCEGKKQCVGFQPVHGVCKVDGQPCQQQQCDTGLVCEAPTHNTYQLPKNTLAICVDPHAEEAEPKRYRHPKSQLLQAAAATAAAAAATAGTAAAGTAAAGTAAAAAATATAAAATATATATTTVFTTSDDDDSDNDDDDTNNDDDSSNDDDSNNDDDNSNNDDDNSSNNDDDNNNLPGVNADSDDSQDLLIPLAAGLGGLLCLGALGAAAAAAASGRSGSRGGGGGYNDYPDYGYEPSYGYGSYGSGFSSGYY